MAKEVIKYCPITLTSSFIRMPFVDNKKSIWYNRNGGYHSGIDIECRTVYALCPCVCTYIGYDTNDKHVVIVQYDAYTSFRYANLATVSVAVNEIIPIETEIGTTYDGFVHFEYWNRTESEWIARVGKETYYKHDPYEYAVGNVEFDLSTEYDIEYDVDPDLQTLF